MTRRPNDFYPTPDSIIQAMLDHYKIYPENFIIWEPCAGDGRLVRALENHYISCEVHSSDIVKDDDFFYYKTCVSEMLITNPPFKYIRSFIDHAFAIGVKQMMLVCPERLWACKKGREQFNRHRPSVWANLDWREDYLGKGGAPDRALAVAIWNKPHSRTCKYEIWSKP